MYYRLCVESITIYAQPESKNKALSQCETVVCGAFWGNTTIYAWITRLMHVLVHRVEPLFSRIDFVNMRAGRN